MTGPRALHEALVRIVADEAGLEPGAIEAAAVERFVAQSARRGLSAADLWARARAREPHLVEALLSAVLVGETFFFRQPEHFRLVRDVIAARPARARPGLSAWSAGCSSGEEAYSLAATLLDAAEGRPVEVLGTDLSAEALARAAAGVYGRWSQREAGPMLYPIGAVDGDTLRVRDELRRTVRYARYNLLDPPPRPAFGFDVVMCRNVFVYLREPAARRVARHLCDALAKDGLLIVGTFGAVDDPALRPIGPRELGAYVRRPADPDPLARRAPPAAGARPLAEEPSESVRIHLQAIHLIEARRLGEAEAVLAALIGRGSYVPALLELALLEERRGRPARAAELAALVLERLGGCDPDADVLGPEPLPVRYYTSTARTFLTRLGGRA